MLVLNHWLFQDVLLWILDMAILGVNGKKLKADMNERKGQHFKHAVHCFNLVYHRRFFSPRRCKTDARGNFINNYIAAHCSLLSGRVMWLASNNSNTGLPPQTPILLSMVNLSVTSRIFPNVMLWTQWLRTVTRKYSGSVEVPVAYTMAERPALTPLALLACLLPTTSVSAIALAAAGVATSSLAAERASTIISVTLPARNPFWSAMHRSAYRIDVSL